MREAIEQQFRQLLEQHDREFLRSASADATRALIEQEFDHRFHEAAKDVIEPVLEKARALMRDHSLHAAIVVTQRHTDADEAIAPSSIVFEFRVLTDAEAEGFPVTIPTLAFIADPIATGARPRELGSAICRRAHRYH